MACGVNFIKSKLIFVALILFVLISLNFVGAADNNTMNNAPLENNQITGNIGNFTDLDGEISEMPVGGNLTLTKDYAYSSNDSDYKQGVLIAKDNIVIDGDGHTINGANQARIFNITANNVTLKNIKFVNGYSNDNGGAIFAIHNLNMLNCHFENNNANASGGAVYIDNAFSNCRINSTFINNSANNGGAIYFNGAITNNTINGYFENNTAERGAGAIYVKGKSSNNTFAAEFYRNHAKATSGGAIFFIALSEDNKFESIFRYNQAAYGAGIFFYNKANNNRFSSDFRFNVAQSCGGAMFFYSTTNGNNFTGYFINNSALGLIDSVNGNGGAITFKNVSSNSIFTCDFINNTAALFGGGVNYRQTPHNITFNSNFINNKAENGGGVNFFENFENVIFNGEFIGNTADYGGAIAVTDGSIENVSFKNNHAKSGGAIYFYGNGMVINSNFTSNTANDADDSCGGAIYFEGNGTVLGSKFISNSARYDGGAVYIWMNGTIEGSNFSDNEAQNGGSIYAHSEGRVNNCNFTNNKARTGGAIEFWDNAIIISSNFSNNVGRFSGGAIYTSRNIKLNDCSFTNNSANEYAGGAVYIYDNVEVNGCNFTDNSANDFGGALYLNRNGTIYGSSFKNNHAEDGGAILTVGNLEINNSQFKDNAAALGTNHVSLKGDATIALIDVAPDDLGPFHVGHLKISNVSSGVYGEIVMISLNVSDENNVPLNNGTVSVAIGGKTYAADVSNGTATISIPNLDAGNYDVNVTYIGNERVAISQVFFKVLKQNATIAAVNRVYVINDGGKYSITLKDAKGNAVVGKKVTFTLNGKYVGYAVTGANGVAKFTLSPKMLKTAKAGVKKLMIKFTDSNYNDASKTVKITIKKEKAKIAAKKKTFRKSVKTKKYTVTLKNSKGKAIKKAPVTLKIKGKKTKKGTYKTTVTFKGNKYYNKVTKKVKIKIK